MLTGRANTYVYGNVGIEFARQLPLTLCRIKRCKFWPGGRESEGDQLIFGREILPSDISNPVILARFGVFPPRVAIGKDRADTRFLNGPNDRISMFPCGLNVRPVEDGGYSRINRAQESDKVANISIFRPIDRGKGVQY